MYSIANMNTSYRRNPFGTLKGWQSSTPNASDMTVFGNTLHAAPVECSNGVFTNVTLELWKVGLSMLPQSSLLPPNVQTPGRF
jgi:hypothetical protein